MKNLLFTILLLLVPNIAFGATYGLGWNGTTTSGTILQQPNLFNGLTPIPYATYFIASSNVASTFPYATTTAISAQSICFTGDICRTGWPSAGAGTYPFTPTTNYAVATNATTGIVWFQNGLQASSTSQLVYASTTAVSGTSLCLSTDCRQTWPTGTVTSVALTVPTFLSVAGSPVTTTGTLAISLSGTALPIANGGTNQTTFPMGLVWSTGSALQSTSSAVTVGSLIATTTTATSTIFGVLSVGSTTPNGVAMFSIGSSTPLFTVDKNTGNMWFDSGNLYIDSNNNRIGISSTTPGSILGIQGVMNFTSATSSGSATGGYDIPAGCYAIRGTCVGGGSGSGTVSSGLAGQIGYYNVSGTTIVGTSTNPLYVNNITASTTSATSTFAGGFTANNGRLVSDWNTGSTTISNLYAGLPQFELNAGVVTALDNPISAAASASTVESYTFNIMGSSSMTFFGKADGAGFVQGGTWGVGVGTTSPWTRFAVSGTGSWANLTAAGATKNSLCIDATTKEVMENAASSCLVSSRRFKHDIEPLSDFDAERIVKKLSPVTFLYNQGNVAAIGLVAEEVGDIDPRLITKDAQGNTNSINYEQITASLVKVVQNIKVASRAEENWQWLIISLLVLVVAYQGYQIKKLK